MVVVEGEVCSSLWRCGLKLKARDVKLKGKQLHSSSASAHSTNNRKQTFGKTKMVIPSSSPVSKFISNIRLLSRVSTSPSTMSGRATVRPP